MKSKPDPSQIRANKLRRHEQQKQMEDNLARLNLERSRNADDDSVLVGISFLLFFSMGF